MGTPLGPKYIPCTYTDPLTWKEGLWREVWLWQCNPSLVRRMSWGYMYIDMYVYILVISLNKGRQYRPQNAIALIIGTPKMVPPIMGKPPIDTHLHLCCSKIYG